MTPPDHIEMTPHLHDAGFEARISATFLGQAHLAGTGPCEKTCRECRFWFVMKRPDPEAPAVPSSPGYYGKRSGNRDVTPGTLKRAACNYAIHNKAKRRVPHSAKACRFFEQANSPPPVEKEAK